MLKSNARYHKDIYMPSNLNFEEFWEGIKGVIETSHFVDRKTQREMPKPSLEELKSAEVFEVYTCFGKLTKVCVKIYKEDLQDCCYVLSKNSKVVTGWKRYRNAYNNKVENMVNAWVYDTED